MYIKFIVLHAWHICEVIQLKAFESMIKWNRRIIIEALSTNVHCIESIEFFNISRNRNVETLYVASFDNNSI